MLRALLLLTESAEATGMVQAEGCGREGEAVREEGRRLAKDEAIRAHNRLRPQLQLLYPSAARVRSFFLDDRRSGAEVDEVDEG